MQSRVFLENLEQSPASNVLYLRGMSRGPGLGDYRVKWYGGGPHMVTNCGISVNGAIGEEPENAEDAFMLQLVSDVDPHPALLIAAASQIRTYDGIGNAKSRECDLAYSGPRSGSGLNIYNHGSYVSDDNCENLFIRWDTNEAQIGVDCPGASVSRNLRITVPTEKQLFVTAGYLNVESKFVKIDPNVRNVTLLGSDMSLGSILSFRQDGGENYGFDWVFSNADTALRLDTVNNGVHAIALGINRTNANIGIGTTAFGVGATKALIIASGTAPASTPNDITQMWCQDVGGEDGKAALHMLSEGVGVPEVIASWIQRDEAGDTPGGRTGLGCINSVDHTIKVYACGAWRTLSAW